MENKARFIGKSYDKTGHSTHLYYAYRGHEYMITNERDGRKSLAIQHREEQRRIDYMIARQERQEREEIEL